MGRTTICVLLLSLVAFAQSSPTFEVASIRPSSEQINQVSAGVRIAGSQARLVGMSLKDYIGMAYSVKPQQIAGPDWLGQERFDIAATIPAGGSSEQFPAMMQSLLVERFAARAARGHRRRRDREDADRELTRFLATVLAAARFTFGRATSVAFDGCAGISEHSYASRSQSVIGASTWSRCVI
jgi:hypothetical protein